MAVAPDQLVTKPRHIPAGPQIRSPVKPGRGVIGVTGKLHLPGVLVVAVDPGVLLDLRHNQPLDAKGLLVCKGFGANTALHADLVRRVVLRVAGIVAGQDEDLTAETA